MKILIFLVGLFLSIWVGWTIYGPVTIFFDGVETTYISGKANLARVEGKVDIVAEKAAEYARIFGSDVAEEKIREFISERNTPAQKNAIEKFFEYNIPFWISLFAGVTTMSLYLNILTFIAFFFKPITFFMKK